MMRVFFLLALVFGIGLIGAFVFVDFRKKSPTGRDNGNSFKAVANLSDKEQAFIKAKQIFLDLKSEGTDFSKGPCISEDLMADWVADVAHNPRQPIDDLSENQCPSFREGKAHHFIELDIEGKLIRAY